jgi:hypothetical protein
LSLLAISLAISPGPGVCSLGSWSARISPYSSEVASELTETNAARLSLLYGVNTDVSDHVSPEEVVGSSTNSRYGGW